MALTSEGYQARTSERRARLSCRDPAEDLATLLSFGGLVQPSPPSTQLSSGGLAQPSPPPHALSSLVYCHQRAIYPAAAKRRGDGPWIVQKRGARQRVRSFPARPAAAAHHRSSAKARVAVPELELHPAEDCASVHAGQRASSETTPAVSPRPPERWSTQLSSGFHQEVFHNQTTTTRSTWKKGIKRSGPKHVDLEKNVFFAAFT